MREEQDTLGKVFIENNNLWGAQTQRSLNNFSISCEKIPIEMIYAFAVIKKASAEANHKLGLLSNEKLRLIANISDEILDKKYDDQFPLFIWQTGSGTHTNMNINEVIANIASLKTGKKLGSKDPLHPNDDVNMSQSSNDTFPTAMHIAAYLLVKNKLLTSLDKLIEGLEKKVKEFDHIIKVGRTHLMDAVPLTLGQEFSAYLYQIKNAKDLIKGSLNNLSKLALGATAVGTGINTHRDFSKLAIQEISKNIKENFVPADNMFSALSSNDAVADLSNNLSLLGSVFFKMSTDISLLASGPRCGLNELSLPANEPGSSIMPGKVNPTQMEALKMVSIQVISNNNSITMANFSGNFQLNTCRPLIIYNLIQSIHILSGISISFLEKCLIGINPNIENIKNHVENTLMLATVLNKKIGYEKAAQIVKKAHKENISLKEAAICLKIVDEKTYHEIIDPKKMVRPHV